MQKDFAVFCWMIMKSSSFKGKFIVLDDINDSYTLSPIGLYFT